MNTFPRLLALALLGASTTLTPLPAASQPQPIDPRNVPVQCCVPAQRLVNTNAASLEWRLQPPAVGMAPVAVSPTPSWAPALPGSEWIGPSANAGTFPGAAPGQYTYTYHFCLCDMPSNGPFPASLFLKVMSDNSFVAYLNYQQIGANSAAIAFLNPTSILSAPSSYFQPGDNTLTFVVTNLGSSGNTGAASTNGSQKGVAAAVAGPTPTGLDVSGWIAGYFRQMPARVPCPRVPPRPR